MWEGKTVAVIASGPSLTRADVEKVRGIPCIAINDNGIDTVRKGVTVPAMAPWAEMLYACDKEWWDKYPQALTFAGLKVSCMRTAPKGVLTLDQTGSKGFDPDPTRLKTGLNSGYQAVHIAIHAKAKRILLLGFDMSRKRGAHWFGEHPPSLRNTHEDTFEMLALRFADLNDRGSEIINCTERSAIKCFPSMTIESAL
jgi:hypothetical protein